MVKTSELRVGNLLQRITHNGQHVSYEKVERIEGNYYGELPSSNCHSIKLNAEWLKKLGAKPMSPISKDYWLPITNLKSELHFETFSNTDEIVTTLKGQFSDLILDRIRSVHELQNLYYSLTKSELSVS